MTFQTYKVWNHENGEDEAHASTIEATDARHAVEVWAEGEDNRGDYTIVGGQPETVKVRGEDGNVSVWAVEGETVPAYSATQLDVEALDV